MLRLEELESRAVPAAGDLDLGFGTNGVVLVPLPEFGGDRAQAVAVQPDGKIVAVGGDNGTHAVVVRLDPDGSLDQTFDGDGIVRLGAPVLFQMIFKDVAIQPDGKILAVAGENGTTALARFNPDGSLDPTFGQAGIARTSLVRANRLALQPDGKIVVGGSGTGGQITFAAARFTAAGQLDTTFGTAGGASVAFSGSESIASSLALQPDGKILIGGNVRYFTEGLGVVRLNPDGSLDNTFDGDGRVVTHAPGTGGIEVARALAVQPDGKILAAGQVLQANGAFGTFSIFRYNPDGSLDPTFGQGGVYVQEAFGANGGSFEHLVVRADGSFVAVGGMSGPAVGTGSVVARYDAAGPFDRTFVSSAGQPTPGFVVTDLHPTDGETWLGVALQPGGQIVAAGYAGQRFAIVRYQGSPLTDDPIAVGDTLATVRDTPLPIAAADLTANDVSPAGRPLTVQIETLPAQGTLATNPDGSFTYTPEAGFAGTTTFTYRVSDGTVTSDPATVVIRVTSSNTPPTANGQTLSVTEDGRVSITLSGSDAQTAPAALSFRIRSLPTRGTLLYQGEPVTAGAVYPSGTGFEYAAGAAGGEPGTDLFTFSARDTAQPASDALDSPPALVRLDVLAAVAPRTAVLGGDGVLRFAGTSTADRIALSVGRGRRLVVQINGVQAVRPIPLGQVSEVRVWARAGNDAVTVRGLTLPVFVHGGDGKDVLTSVDSSATLFGGDGDDRLTGGRGHEVLIGGAGRDRVVGGGGNNVLIGGELSKSFLLADLLAASRRWALDRVFTQGLGRKVVDDDSLASEDQLAGGAGADWFLLGALDDVLGVVRANDRLTVVT